MADSCVGFFVVSTVRHVVLLADDRSDTLIAILGVKDRVCTNAFQKCVVGEETLLTFLEKRQRDKIIATLNPRVRPPCLVGA